LDEAASNLDSESEMRLQSGQRIGDVRPAGAEKPDEGPDHPDHRPPPVHGVEADRILGLKEGRITGRGTHEELMTSHDLYRRLAKQQLQPSA
jgi:ATP-binding cassette, subfamily B, bacterial AbcA/BmrA